MRGRHCLCSWSCFLLLQWNGTFTDIWCMGCFRTSIKGDRSSLCVNSGVERFIIVKFYSICFSSCKFRASRFNTVISYLIKRSSLFLGAKVKSLLELRVVNLPSCFVFNLCEEKVDICLCQFLIEKLAVFSEFSKLSTVHLSRCWECVEYIVKTPFWIHLVMKYYKIFIFNKSELL